MNSNMTVFEIHEFIMETADIAKKAEAALEILNNKLNRIHRLRLQQWYAAGQDAYEPSWGFIEPNWSNYPQLYFYDFDNYTVRTRSAVHHGGDHAVSHYDEKESPSFPLEWFTWNFLQLQDFFFDEAAVFRKQIG